MSRARDFADLAGSADAGGLTGRNIAINGAMTVAQRSTSETGQGASSGYTTLDRFRHEMGGDATAGRFTISQNSVTDLSGFSKSLKIQCTTADTSTAASEGLLVQQRFEGQDLQRLMNSSTSTKEFTLSFYAKQNETRNIVVEIRTSQGTNRQICKLFAVTSSWARYEFTVPAQASGMTINDDNSNELQLNFWLHAGSTFTSGTLDTSFAGSTNANRAVGVGSIFASTSNFIEITGVQLEVGQATPFEHEPFGVTLQKAMRYYEKGYDYPTAPGASATYPDNIPLTVRGQDEETSGQRYFTHNLKVEKRAAPTNTFYDESGNTGKVTTYDSGGTPTNNVSIGLVVIMRSRIGAGPGNSSIWGHGFFYESDAEL
jgi:hypothetical protein